VFVQRRSLDAFSVYLILEGSFAVFFAMIVTVNLVYQVEVARLDPLQLVLVGTTLEAVSFVGQVPTGVLADVFSRRLAVVAGMVLTGAGFVLEGSIPTFWAILLAQVIWGTGAALVSGAEEAWIAGEVGEERIGHAFMRGSQIALLGGLLGAGVSVALAGVRLNLPIVVGGGLIVALGGFLALAMPERNFLRRGEHERATWREMSDTVRTGARLVRGSPALLTILGVAVFFGMSGEGFDRLNAAHFLKDFTLPALGPLKPVTWFGVMAAVSTLLGIVLTEVVRRRLDTDDHAAVARFLTATNALMIGSMIGFGLAGTFPLALGAYWGVTILRRANGPIYNTWLARSIEPSVRATVISMSGLVDAFGQIAGGPVIGLIGTAVSLRAAMVAAGAALSPALALFARAARRRSARAAGACPARVVRDP
jgi:MFS transporter, DHA3 family, tetracycline resistance protein